MNSLPMVTIAMPVLNEAAHIEPVLSAVYHQDYPGDRLEVIIADGMSNDGTRDIINDFIARKGAQNGNGRGPTISIINNEGHIVSTGLNKAIRRARGEIIVRVDGHTFIEPDYVTNCVASLEKSGADGVGGGMTTVGEGYTAEAIAAATRSPFGIGNSTYRTSRFLRERYVETTHMGAYRKETLLKIGLFDENLVRHQDYELDYRIRRGGGAIFLSPNIRSRYFVRGSLRKLWRQYFQYGFWKGRFLRQNIVSIKWRHTVPPLFVLALAVGVLTSLLSPTPGAALLALVLAAYALFLVAGTLFVCANKSRVRFAPIVPFIFLCLHLAWGSGAWFGFLLPDSLSPSRWPR